MQGLEEEKLKASRRKVDTVEALARDSMMQAELQDLQEIQEEDYEASDSESSSEESPTDLDRPDPRQPLLDDEPAQPVSINADEEPEKQSFW